MFLIKVTTIIKSPEVKGHSYYTCSVMATGLNKKVLHAALRSVPAESYITLSLTLTGKLHRLQRPKDENLEKTLKRISLTVVKAEKKERKKRGEKETQTCPPPVVTLFDKEGKEEVAVDTPNVSAWIEGAWLTVDHSRYLVTVNAPVVRKLEVPTCIMAGCPIVPQASENLHITIKTSLTIPI